MATKIEEVVMGIMGKKYIAISDLHIGIRSGDPEIEFTGRSSDYYYSDEETNAYLLGLIKNGYTVILDGDILELWETDKSMWLEEVGSLLKCSAKGESFADWHESRARERFEAIAKKYPKTIELFRTNPNIIYINGNHDEACRTQRLMPTARENITIKEGGFTLHFAHGHQADKYCSGAQQKIGRWCTCFASVEEEFIDPDIDIKLSALAETVGLTHDNDSTYSNHARLLAEAGRLDVVVYGHTHVPQLATVQCKTKKKINGDKVIYANTGRACHSDSHERIDEIEIHVDKDGVLELTMQQRYPLTGTLQKTKHIRKTQKGLFLEEELDQREVIAQIPRRVVLDLIEVAPPLMLSAFQQHAVVPLSPPVLDHSVANLAPSAISSYATSITGRLRRMSV